MKSMTNKKLSKALPDNYYQKLLNSLPDSMAVLNSDLTVRSVNAAFAELLGYSVSDIIGLPISKIIPSEDFQLFSVNELTSDQTINSIQTNFLNKQGIDRPVLMSLSAFQNEEGDIESIILTARDITEQMKEVDELIRSEKMFRSMVENSPLMVAHRLRSERGYQYWNRGIISSTMEEWNSLSYEEQIDRVHPDDWDLMVPIHKEWQASENSDYLTLEYRLKDKDGKYHWFECHFSKVYSDDGEFIATNEFSMDISLRKKIERELKQYENIVSNTSDMVALLDKEYHYIIANDSYLERMTRNRSDFIGKSAIDVFGAKFFSAVIKPSADRCLSGEFVNYQTWIKFPNGEKLYMDVSYSPYCTTENEIVGFVVNARNITERKLVEEDLIVSEVRATALLEAIPDMMFRIDSKGVFLDYQAEKSKLYVQDGDSLIGSNISESLPTEFAKDLAHKIKRIIKSGKMETFDYQLLMREGRITDYEARMVKSGEDEVTAIVRDITERKMAEDALRINEEKYRVITETSLDAIYQLNLEGNITFMNRAGATMFGYTSEEIEGMNFGQFLDENRLEEGSRYVERVLSGENVEGEITVINKYEGEFPIHFSMTPIWKGDEVIGFTGIARDITDQKITENNQIALMAELKEANNELQDFAHVVSHDLKAPLRGINSLVKWIAEDYGDILDDDGRRKIKGLSKRVKKMHNMIEAILKFSRTGLQKIDVEKLDVKTVIKESIEILMVPKDIIITIKDPMPKVIYAHTHLEQIFINLVGNAIKHMGKSGDKVAISSKELRDSWEICVQDNGIGIEERHLERIFNIFETLTEDDSGESTGIGLTLVKKLVERYNGEIRVKSTVGSGSAFFFTIPKDITIRPQTGLIEEG